METKTKTKTKIIIIMIALLLMIGVTGFTYAYWNSLQKKEDVNLSIGTGTILSVNLSENIPQGKKLVPPDVLLGENDITSFVLLYNAKLDKVPQVPPVLNVEVSNIKIGGEDTYADLVIININKPETITNLNATVTVTISLKNQADITEEAYNAINLKQITFDLTFNAVAA